MFVISYVKIKRKLLKISSILVKPHRMVTNVLDCNIIVSKFKLQWHYYITFGLIPLRKIGTPLSSQLCVK